MGNTQVHKKLKQMNFAYQEKLKKQRRNSTIFLGITAMVLGFSGYLIFKALYKPPMPTAQNVINIDADMGGFSMSEIHVKVGEPVTIRLRSLDGPYHTDGGGQHQWAVDEFNVSVVAPPNGISMATFTPDKTGEFDFYCDLCCGGKANPSMNGKFIVDG